MTSYLLSTPLTTQILPRRQTEASHMPSKVLDAWCDRVKGPTKRQLNTFITQKAADVMGKHNKLDWDGYETRGVLH